ncbi:MAG: ArsA family ATPase [Myxococcales bacterium]|nr:arsenic-transporting ATPase [Myxococcales bacterium]HIK85804.1 arsenic-transporting ATPase [Myxococcales bacterium]
MRLILYTGKGGVGKTTTAAATGALAAEQGLRTLVVSADAAHSLGDVFDVPLGPEPRRLAERLDALEVDARHVIESHWGRVRGYLVALLRYQGIEEVIADELALLPGADELATLVSVEKWAESGDYDLILVDCAPTGSTLRLVTLPEVAHSGLRWMLRLQRATARVVEPLARGLIGAPLPNAEVFAEADRLFYKTLHRLRARLLSAQTSIRIVVTPESMVIDEARRSLTDLCLFQLASDAVIVNRVLPEQACREAFFQEWGRTQIERIRDVKAAFSPMACLTAPLEPDEVRGVAALSEHGKMLFGDRDPAGRLGSSLRLRFERDQSGARIRLPLPGLDPAALDVIRIEDELVIGVGERRRKIALPIGFAKLEIDRVSYRDGELLVSFGTASSSHSSPSSPCAATQAAP